MVLSDLRRSTDNFSDEETDADMDGDTMAIDYDEFAMDSSRGTTATARGSDPAPPLKRTSTDDKPMIQHGISSTSRWKVIVIILMLVNTTIVVLATSLYLNHEEDKEFQRAVSW